MALGENGARLGPLGDFIPALAAPLILLSLLDKKPVYSPLELSIMLYILFFESLIGVSSFNLKYYKLGSFKQF